MAALSEKLTLYVYYKIPAELNELYLLAVKQLNQAIGLRYPEVTMQLQKRPDVDETNQETWMEIYVGIAQMRLENLLADLLELVEAHGLPRKRKNEVFIDLNHPNQTARYKCKLLINPSL